MDKPLALQLSALSHPQRLALFGLLMRRFPDRLPAGEVGRVLGARPSTLSAWLNDLSEAGLIEHERRATSLLYRARPEGAQALVAALLGDVCRGRADPVPTEPTGAVRNVLFLGAGNAARSLMAEALLRDAAGARFEAFSAALGPPAEPAPEVLAMLGELGHDNGLLWAKPADGFLDDAAPRMDLVISLSDEAVNDGLRRWPGAPVQAHWGLPDPLRAEDEAEALAQCYLTLRARIDRLAALPAELPRDALQAELDALASMGAEEG